MLSTSCNFENSNYEINIENYTETDYFELISGLKKDMDSILLESKPQGFSLEVYKRMILLGDMHLSSIQKKRILISSEKLSRYGKFLLKKSKIDIDINDKSNQLAFGGLFKPTDNINSKIINQKNDQITLKMNPWIECALFAIGADAIWALGSSSASAWTAAAMTKAFTAVAKRFLGPIGVAIAVVSFGVCLAEQSDNL